LRDLLQEAGIPPWQRSRLPLMFDADGALLAVADLWISEAGAELLARADARLDWSAGVTATIDLAGALS
jgi:tRNA(Ile)-lysidine synthase